MAPTKVYRTPLLALSLPVSKEEGKKDFSPWGILSFLFLFFFFSLLLDLGLGRL